MPTGVIINDRLASDNATFGVFMRNLGDGSCAFVAGVPEPINPNGTQQFQAWWDFSFRNPVALTPGSDLLLYVLLANAPNGGNNPTGLRVEFSNTSVFY